jgi:hypothetical protein
MGKPQSQVNTIEGGLKEAASSALNSENGWLRELLDVRCSHPENESFSWTALMTHLGSISPFNPSLHSTL